MTSLKSMFSDQAAFNENFFKSESLTTAEREHLTMVFAASLQKEIGHLLDGVNFRQHRLIDKDPKVDIILHEAVDAWRYLVGIMNLWDIDPDTFQEAWADRDLFLQMRHEKESEPWVGQPVLIVDIDDVVSSFRDDCTRWAKEAFPGQVDDDDHSYYSLTQEQYGAYVQARQLKCQGVIQPYVDAVNKLYDMGVWIHLLTARPKEELTIKYDTYAWLKNSGLKFNRVSFDSEKFLWVARTDYYKKGRVIAAVDDSPKHAGEYAMHGLPCLVPTAVHNAKLETGNGIYICQSADEMFDYAVKFMTDMLEKSNNS